MCRGGGVRVFQPAYAVDIPGKSQNFPVVDVINHNFPIYRRPIDCDCRICTFNCGAG
jgi:hypothetical protein